VFNTATFSLDNRIVTPRGTTCISLAPFQGEVDRLTLHDDLEGFTLAALWHPDQQEWEVWYYTDRYKY
jgi:hypothetical protein